MTRIPTEAEINAMSEEELEAYLEGKDLATDVEDHGDAADQGEAAASSMSHGGASGLLARSGAPRRYAIGLAIGSIVGIAASWELMASEIKVLREPMANLTCDINPLVSCGDTLNVWQGNLLGVPNSFIGAMAFSVMLALALLLGSGVKLPRWMWWGMTAGTLGGIAFVAWFLGVSVLTFGKLCPFCMIIWSVTIPIATSTWGQAALGGHLGMSRRAAGRLWAARWWLAGAMYVTIIAIVLIAFWDGWVALLAH